MVKYFFTILLFFTINSIFAQKINFEYDNLSRLTRVNYSNGSSVIYQYDANGNRTLQFVAGSTTVYVFTGNGNWSTAANWKNQQVPPLELPAGSQILIDPVTNGECLLDVPQKILPGGLIRVEPGKKLRIPGTLKQ